MSEYGGFRFVHYGVAVADLEAAARFYVDALDHAIVRGPYDDPVQGARVLFLADRSRRGEPLELVAPLEKGSHVERLVARQAGAYHACYEVDDLHAALDRLRRAKCVVVKEPAPATAFDGRLIAWVYTPSRALVELLEASRTGTAG